MAYPSREDWLQKALEESSADRSNAEAKRALTIGPVAWLAYVESGRQCTLEEAAAATEDVMEVFGPQQVTVLSYLQFVQRTAELIRARLRDTAQSGSVGQAGGEQDPAPS